MAPYIAFNTAMRAKARSDFEKDLYKLKSKTMENFRERRDIQAATGLHGLQAVGGLAELQAADHRRRLPDHCRAG